MVTLTTIVLLIVILQQIAFDSKIEYESGASYYHSFRAYHASKSGIELALFKILIYKKVISYLNNKSQDSALTPFINQYYKYAHWIWNQPLIWPIKISPDLSEARQSELQDKIEKSLFQTSYQTKIEAESSKLNLMDIVHPASEDIRNWAKATFYNLIVNTREKSRWFQDNYSINEIQELIEEVEKMLHPAIWNKMTQTYSIHQLDDLKHIENKNPEWIEWIRPYVTLYSEGGLNAQWAESLILQSLHNSMTDEKAQSMIDQKIEDDIYISDFKSLKQFFVENEMESAMLPYEDQELPLKDLVFNFAPPQIFKIISIGESSNISHKTEVILYDSEHIIHRTYKLMNQVKEKTDYEKPTLQSDPVRYRNNATKHDEPLSIKTSPFIIHWKDIN